MMGCGIGTSTDSTIYFSPRWKGMFGYEEGEIGTDPDEWFDRIHPDERESTQRAVFGHLVGTTAHLESEHRIRHRDGGYRWVLCRGLAVRNPDGVATRVAGSFTDITARSRQRRNFSMTRSTTP